MLSNKMKALWIAALAASADASHAGTIAIVNEGFETGDLTGWWSSGQAAAIDWDQKPVGGGTWTGFLSNVGGWGQIGQAVSNLEGNTDYVLAFAGAASSWQPTAKLTANLSAYDYGTSTGITLVQQEFTVTADNGVSNWQTYTVNLSGATVASAFPTWVGKELSLSFWTSDGNPVEVDKISLTTTAVPEPASLVLLGLGTLTLLHRRRA